MTSSDPRIIRELDIYETFKDNYGIPDILHVETYGDELIVFEEFIEGNDLANIMAIYKGDSVKVRLLIKNIAEILTPVWAQRYVHRDLKPQNIIIKTDGSPTVLDFGIARDLDDETITPTGFQPFSPAYGSPEQYLYKRDYISYRTDFFCLGIIAHVLFTGNFPFGKNRTDIGNCFQGDQKHFDIGDENLNQFLNCVLRFNVAERPRTPELFIKSLNL